MSSETNSVIFAIILLASPILALIFLTLWLKARKARNLIRARFENVISVDDELERVSKEREVVSKDIETLKTDYKDKRKTYDALRHQVGIFDEQVSFAEYGVYEPHFDFGESDDYKRVVKAVREEQKLMIKDKRAVHAPGNWTVDGSSSKGKTMMSRATRLALRAFNAEADSAISNARWNNAEAMIKRIENARTQIDKANASLSLTQPHYNGWVLKPKSERAPSYARI